MIDSKYFTTLLANTPKKTIHTTTVKNIKQAYEYQSDNKVTICILLLNEKKPSLRHYMKKMAATPVVAVLPTANTETEDTLIHDGAQDVIDQSSITSRGLTRVIHHAIERHQLSKALLDEQALIQNIAQQVESEESHNANADTKAGHMLVKQNIDLLKKIHSRKNMLDYMAHHDVLTNLPNRLKFEKEFTETLEHSKRHKHQFAVMFVDLDGFKPVNDQYGHQAGDAILKAFAKRVRNKLRSRDFIARIGGDEFAIICNEIKNELSAGVIANKIIRALDEPFEDICGENIHIGASIGISNFPEDSKDGSDLLKLADKAMYAAKKSGKNQYHFASQKIQKQIVPNFVSKEFRDALKNQNVYLAYQPTINLQQSNIDSMELSLQWQHTGLALGNNQAFTPLSEHAGQFSQIGHWIFNSACKQLCADDQKPQKPLNLALAVESFQLQSQQLCESILKIVDVYQVPADRVQCHKQIEDSPAKRFPMALMSKLNELGLQAELQRLKKLNGAATSSQLHFVSIKVDNRLLNNYNASQNNDGIIELLIHLEPLPKSDTVTIDITPNHFYRIQGYHFSKPASSEEMQRYLSKDASFQ